MIEACCTRLQLLKALKLVTANAGQASERDIKDGRCFTLHQPASCQAHQHAVLTGVLCPAHADLLMYAKFLQGVDLSQKVINPDSMPRSLPFQLRQTVYMRAF
jgi:hypothetical protein